MSETPLADEIETHLISRDIAGALWDNKPCCDKHVRMHWSTGTGWPEASKSPAGRQ